MRDFKLYQRGFQLKKMNTEDVSQIFAGASILSALIVYTDEIWRLGETLSTFGILFVIFLSLLMIGLYIYHGIFEGYVRIRMKTFVVRIFVIYLLSLLIVTTMLLALQRYPIIAFPISCIKQSITIAFPASMGAAIIDSLDKE